MLSSLALLLAVFQGQVAAPMIGEPAPKLQIASWLRGPAVPRFLEGHVYVIDIWAPWCGPCVGGMHHLSDLQRKYTDQGLTVIGLASDDKYGSSLESVQKLLGEKKDIHYSIAWDDHKKSYSQWMAIEKVQGWPWSFIIDRKGRVAYIGHPEHMDVALRKIIEGGYDLDEARREYEAVLAKRKHG